MLSWQYSLLIACRNNLLHTGMSRVKMNGFAAPDTAAVICSAAIKRGFAAPSPGFPAQIFILAEAFLRKTIDSTKGILIHIYATQHLYDSLAKCRRPSFVSVSFVATTHQIGCYGIAKLFQILDSSLWIRVPRNFTGTTLPATFCQSVKEFFCGCCVGFCFPEFCLFLFPNYDFV